MIFDEKITELIAIGASVAVNCQPCVKYHINIATKTGATEQEIKAAIEVGRTVKKGATNHMDKFVAHLTGEPIASTSEDNKQNSCCSS